MTATMANPPGWARGDLLPSLGYSRCYGCHKPWYAADEPVSVAYGSTCSQFTMGRGCWARATIEERLDAHQWACDEWERMRAEDGATLNDDKPPLLVIRRRIEQAIRSDDLEMWRLR